MGRVNIYRLSKSEIERLIEEEKATQITYLEKAVFDAVRLAFKIDKMLPPGEKPAGYRSIMHKIWANIQDEVENDEELREIIYSKDEIWADLYQYFRIRPSNNMVDFWWEVMTEWLKNLSDGEKIALKGYALDFRVKQILRYYERKTGSVTSERSIYTWFKSAVNKVLDYVIREGARLTAA